MITVKIGDTKKVENGYEAVIYKGSDKEVEGVAVRDEEGNVNVTMEKIISGGITLELFQDGVKYHYDGELVEKEKGLYLLV